MRFNKRICRKGSGRGPQGVDEGSYHPGWGGFLFLWARPGRFCQLKCQHGRFLSKVPGDKGCFGPGLGAESFSVCLTEAFLSGPAG